VSILSSLKLLDDRSNYNTYKGYKKYIKSFVGKSKGRIIFVIPGSRSENNIKTNLHGIRVLSSGI
jgi:hypothetical protein